jgi:hypothetical protein
MVPLQAQVLDAVAVSMIGLGCVIPTQIHVSHPVQVSVIRTQYKPALNPVKHGFVVPVPTIEVQLAPSLYFRHGFVVPVVVLIQILPLAPPLQLTFVTLANT